MNQRSLAVSILERARDVISQRLSQRVVESQQEIEADAEGNSYLSEIETIYDELGARLTHLNAMLANLPASSGPSAADITASEIIYADLATSNPIRVDLDGTTLLALPAPAGFDKQAAPGSTLARLEEIAVGVERGDLEDASGLIGHLFDVKPSQAVRSAAALARYFAERPGTARRALATVSHSDGVDPQNAAELLAEMFDLSPAETLDIVHAIRHCREKVSDAP